MKTKLLSVSLLMMVSVMMSVDISAQVIEATCAEVIAGEDGQVYRVTGRVVSIANTNYGNWYLEDETGQIYIYGTVDKNGKYPKSTSWEMFGINEGDMVTVQGPKSTYKGNAELVDVQVLSPMTLFSDENHFIEWEATDIVCRFYCEGNDYSIDIPEKDRSWLTVKSRTEGHDPVVTIGVKENEGPYHWAGVTFSTIIGGEKYEIKVTIIQYGYRFKAFTDEGVEMSFRIGNYSTEEKKECNVEGGIFIDHIQYNSNNEYEYLSMLPINNRAIVIDTLTEGRITIPSQVNGYTVTYIQKGSFWKCRNITSVIIPANVSIIRHSVFQECTNLEEVIFLGATGDIRFGAFCRCPNLKKIVRYSADPGQKIAENAFYYSNEDMEDNSVYDRVTLYVPFGAKSVYQQVAPWSFFKNIVEMGETGIEPILQFGYSPYNKSTYDIQGRKVKTMGKPGVYIIEGRKLVVK